MQRQAGTIVYLAGVVSCLALSISFQNTIAAAGSGEFQTTVATRYGRIRGMESENNTLAWKGIPYAKPPVGELRWKAPGDPDPWDGIRETTRFGDPCSQFVRDGSVRGSEDCLYMNIWRPKSAAAGLPVYFWIHGGGHSVGMASTDRYDGVKIAARSNLVVVTINYRLGPMGWFSHPALRGGTSPRDDSGNYSNLDMIQGLDWVHDNIEAFGGDPHNVTVAGVSAGAGSVLSLLISPLARGLFHKAIAESGGIVTNPVEAGDAHAEAIVEKLLLADGSVADRGQGLAPYPRALLQAKAARVLQAEMPRADLEHYLRSKTPEQILKSHERPRRGPMIQLPCHFSDGTVLHEEGFAALQDPAKYNQVPLILGANKEEQKRYMGEGPAFETLDETAYQAAAVTTSNDKIRRSVDVVAAILAPQKNQPPIYAYQFNYGAYNPGGYNAWPTDFQGVNYALRFGASHGLEVPFFWGNPVVYGYEDVLFREDNRRGYEALTDAMMACAAQFARTGSPGSPGGVWWQPWSHEDGGPKRVLLDADDHRMIIRMSRK